MKNNENTADGVKVRINDREALLGSDSGGPVQHLVPASGLKIARFDFPAQITHRNVMAPWPVLTLLQRGQTRSRLRYGLQDEDADCKAGELMCYRGGMEIQHARWVTQNAHAVSVEIDPHRLAKLEDGDVRFAERLATGSPRFEDPQLGAVVLALWTEHQSGNPKGALYSDSLCLGLAARVYRRFGGWPSVNRTEARDAQARLSATQMSRIEAYVREHLGGSIGLSDLAQQVGMGRFHFTRLFTLSTGKSPYQYVLHQRLERAYHLLFGTDMPIAQVALAVGFSSQSHFTDACKRVLGKTPGALRESRGQR